MPKNKDISGKKFDRLITIRFIESRNGRAYWLFKCDCGMKVVRSPKNALRVGSCGGHKGENISSSKAKYRPFMLGTPERNSWGAMINRCRYDNPRYGGRGIRVCSRWHSFELFFEDMGYRSVGMTLERKDNDGNYCPENCVWATLNEQCNNKSNNRFIEFEGEILTVAQWSVKTGIGPTTLLNRLNQNFSMEKVFSVNDLRSAQSSN